MAMATKRSRAVKKIQILHRKKGGQTKFTVWLHQFFCLYLFKTAERINATSMQWGKFSVKNI